MSGRSTWHRIEVATRYADRVPDVWPVRVEPGHGELLSSWLHRLALANGVPPVEFADTLGQGGGMWSARLDHDFPPDLAERLERHTRSKPGTIKALALEAASTAACYLPLHARGDHRRALWLQFCPTCLADYVAFGYGAIFFKQWREATRVSCLLHRCALHDRCPECSSGIVAFAQSGLVAQHYCARCGFDLRGIEVKRVSARVRRLEGLVNTIVAAERSGLLPCDSEAISHIIRAPETSKTAREALPRLSHRLRLQCYRRLAAFDGVEPSADPEDGPRFFWRRLGLAANGHLGRSGRKSAAHTAARSRGSCRKAGRLPSLATLLRAYADVRGRGPNSRTEA